MLAILKECDMRNLINPAALARHLVLGMTADAGFKVTKGSGFAVNLKSKVMIYPPLPPHSETACDLVVGGVTHEILGHFEHTDVEAAPKTDDFSRALVHSLTNAIEDVRIERRAIEIRPVVKGNLEKLIEALLKENHLDSPSSSHPMIRNLGLYFVLVGGYYINHYQALEKMVQPARDVLIAELGEGIVDLLDVQISKIPSLQCTQDAVDLAVSCLNLVKEELQKQLPESDQDPQGQTDQDQQEDETSQDPNANQDSEFSQDQSDDSTSSDTQNTGGQPTEHVDQPEQDSAIEKIKELLQQLEDEDLHAQLPSNDRMDSIQKSLESFESDETACHPFDVTKAGQAQQTADVLSTVKQQTNALAIRIQELLRVATKKKVTIGHSGRRIVGRKLSRVMIDREPKVFSRKKHAVLLDTSVMALLDASGSMSQSIDLAIAAGAAVSGALDGQKGIENSVAVFPVGGPFGDRLGILKDFENRACQARFGGVSTDGGTPLAEAIVSSLEVLYSRKTARKILIVATDGEPDNLASAAASINAANQLGIEIIGIGIRHNVSHLFTVSDYINSIDQLPITLLNLLKSRLVRVA